MTGHSRVTLKPFGELGYPPGCSLQAEAFVSGADLHLRYLLSALDSTSFDSIVFPNAGSGPERQNELWKETCFECFIPLKNSEGYFEFNFSPNGNWNIYSFESYRAQITEVQVLSFQAPELLKAVRTSQGFECEIKLAGFLALAHPEAFDLDHLGITTVIKSSSGISYWALSHEGAKPDFHLKASFTYSAKKQEND